MSLMAMACNYDPSKKFTMYIHDEELKPYVEYIQNYYGDILYGSYYFKDIPDKVIGLCNHYDPKTITVDPEAWQQLSSGQKWALMLHEMGHCMLDKDHNDLKLLDQCPASIMNTYLVTTDCYTRHMEYYWEELRQ
jgi:hypothetical protein